MDIKTTTIIFICLAPIVIFFTIKAIRDIIKDSNEKGKIDLSVLNLRGILVALFYLVFAMVLLCQYFNYW